MYYGMTLDLTLCGPFESAMDATDDVIHLRTAEEWTGLFDAVAHVAEANPEAPGYYSINGMKVFFLGHQPDKEAAQRACDEVQQIVERDIRATRAAMVQTPGMELYLSQNVEDLIASIPPGRIFTAENVPAWRDQLQQLLPKEA